ncbi:MAG: malate synthase G [Chloroflexi bacterium]|nr:malate synthase G [Chloroflexota bacterium]
MTNARFSINAANARWGSLYDSLYGTDVISTKNNADQKETYNPIRGEKVISFAKNFLNEIFPLKNGDFTKIISFQINNGVLDIKLNNNNKTSLKKGSQFIGYTGNPNYPTSILLLNNDLHIEILIDKKSAIGKTDPAGIKDIIVESAITTIQDCEDSVAAVDSDDKVLVYRNWLGLMKGDIEETFIKNEKKITRKLKSDRIYNDPRGKNFSLPGRSLMLNRNVGHLMTNPVIIDDNGDEVFEGILDAMFTITIAMHDLMKNGKFRNSLTNSIYIVKPKMHGSKEVQFTCDLFSEIEKHLGLKTNTVKIGIMDEERRTTLNLKQCIKIAKNRIIFINTGFLDRTGDEIHTSMEAGAFIPKSKMKEQKWISTYENRNVAIGLESGFLNKAQIGKGMWAQPDEMLAMYKSKINHPHEGASCAWVPSPTAATIHAIHYHQISVKNQQTQILKDNKNINFDDLLTIPIMKNPKSLSTDEIQNELDNNAQGILGYVVRWIDQGIGCSKVPDINNIGLMEDRATCRISSQHISNWLYHGVCSENQVMETMKKMAKIVDMQNESSDGYINMSPNYDGVAFSAACDLVFKGRYQPNGYTEKILHDKRLEFKSKYI